jgi:hypothetical protein
MILWWRGNGALRYKMMKMNRSSNKEAIYGIFTSVFKSRVKARRGNLIAGIGKKCCHWHC